MGAEGWGICCDLLFRTRFSPGDFVEGEGDGAQENRDGTEIALEWGDGEMIPKTQEQAQSASVVRI